MELHDVLEAFRFHWLLFAFVPILLLVTSPVRGAHEIPVFRLQQFDLSGSSFGSRSSMLSLEAATQLSSTPSRQCLIVRLGKLTLESVQNILAKGPGGLLILMPEALHQITKEHRETLQSVEQYLMSESFGMPIFFAVETPEAAEMYASIEHGSASAASRSATEALLASVLSTGFQLEAAGPQSAPLAAAQQHNVEGRLHGIGVEEQLPTVLLVAHYDAMAAAPELSMGADSNGSGVTMLLELSRLLSKLYRSRSTHPRLNLVLLLTAAGKLNYAGSRHWLDEHGDSLETAASQGVQFVLCLDSLAQGDSLSLHVSKPPKPDSSGDKFFQALRSAAADVAPGLNVSMVHKKINLGDRTLAWEHEQFSMRRLPAFTLSHYQAAWDPSLRSLLDTRPALDEARLVRNTRVVAEALARVMFDLRAPPHAAAPPLLFTDEMAVSEEAVRGWLDYLTSVPRPAQLLTDASHHVVASLKAALQRDLHDVRVSSLSADRRQPDWVLYDATRGQVTAYQVKPAVFDLAATAAIAAYLGLVYLAVQNFHQLYAMAQKISPVFKVRVE
ncbi:nicalin-like [Pollicipes pollicipes]|uniref:nicalin-like n=1 Tax=Pollicipes pollicipes TaxID=41117 RepID=UPI00188494F6|nr:nicalin-like [Pollicipes pollicipes]XP_037080227.1 nicalin-like [Pollicipes pollicipes]